MAFTDLYEVLDKQSIGGEQILNAYQVERASGAFGALDIATAFVDSVGSFIRNIQHTTVTHDIVTARSLDDPTDFASVVMSPNTGILTGDQISNFTALTIQFNRRRTDMNNGQKRYAAGNELQAVGNQWAATFITTAQILADRLVQPWETAAAPGVDVCSMVIIKRICTTSPSPPCAGGYRLPLSSDPLTLYTPVSALVRDTIRSQVSRKRLT